jgi:hypothetical protein
MQASDIHQKKATIGDAKNETITIRNTWIGFLYEIFPDTINNGYKKHAITQADAKINIS